MVGDATTVEHAGGNVAPPLHGEFDAVGPVLSAAAAQFGERDAYVDVGERLTFAQWDARADALAAALLERGVRCGDVVALLVPPGIDYAVCFAAVLRIGAVATGLNMRLGPLETASILKRAEARLVIRSRSDEWGAVPAGTAVLDRQDLPKLYRCGRVARHVEVSADDPAVIIWTSGTTGSPKGAWYDHRSLAAAVRSAGVMSAPYDRKLVSTPFAHAGYMAKIWDQIAWGTTVVISPTPWSADDMAEILARERITVAGAVPTQWAKLLRVPGVGATRLPDLRLGIAATAPAPPELVEQVNAVLGVPLVVRYAMTESPSIAGTEPQDPPEVQFRTVGRPAPGMRVAVVDDDGAACSPGTAGSVRVKGACVMRGYWGDQERTRAAFDDDGWLRTGDMGSLTDAGELVLTGRSGDVYIRGGYNIHPLEVENVLSGHPGVNRVAIVGVPAPVIGEIGVAFVVPESEMEPPRLDELRAWVAGRLADYKAPDELVVTDELPLTPMLKVDKQALHVRAAERREA